MEYKRNAEPPKLYPLHGESDSARLFLPFDALKGFREALAEQEQIAEARYQPECCPHTMPSATPVSPPGLGDP